MYVFNAEIVTELPASVLLAHQELVRCFTEVSVWRKELKLLPKWHFFLPNSSLKPKLTPVFDYNLFRVLNYFNFIISYHFGLEL